MMRMKIKKLKCVLVTSQKNILKHIFFEDLSRARISDSGSDLYSVRSLKFSAGISA